MTWLKQNWLKISLGIVLLVALVFVKEWDDMSFNSALISDTTSLSPTPSTEETDGECVDAIFAQHQYLEKEKLSEEFIFEKYAVSNIAITQPAGLDINSDKFAMKFRTMIRNGLDKEGVNFAGHYSIVSVGMTGWGDNYYIVDRTNGKAFTFPYLPYGLDFRKDSNLIIMDSKPLIVKALDETKSYGLCAFIGSEDIRYSDLRPFYFLWEDDHLKLLGPTNIKPHINEFWEAWE